MSLATSSGKTEQLLHLADVRLGQHKGAGRIWLEGRRLVDAGFRTGVRFQLGVTEDTVELRLSRSGDHKVSHKAERPVVDVLTHALGAVDRVQVRFLPGAIRVQLHPIDRAALGRVRRLNERLAADAPLRLGSLCHGGGVASNALLRGLGRAELAFAVEREGAYLAQAMTSPTWAPGTVSVEGDLGDLDASELPQVDVLEAGLPCVSASRAGRSKKHLDRPEQDTTADLVCAFLDVVQATQPSVIVLENVPEYAESASADIIRRRLGRWGYTLREELVDGAAWSLEARQRWLLIATTRGLELDLTLTPGERPAALGELLDAKVDASAWRRFEHLDRKTAQDKAKGNRFQQRILTAASTSVPTLRRGYQKAGSTDPRLAHPSRPGLSRLLTPAEHARIKGVPPELIKGLAPTVAHEVLGQSVIAPSFVALGAAIAASVR
jgi:DNA (cytosine-5)-methyltransferase 1